MLLKACVNGPRPLAEHPRLSADAAVVAEESRRAIAAGAGAIHVHPKRPDGEDSLDAADVARFVEAVRAACPGNPVGVTTGAWTAPDPAARVRAVRSWTVLPDFASVNWHEQGADQVAEALLDRGVGVEAGIWHPEGLHSWQASPWSGRCLRALVELPDLQEPTPERVEDLARPLLTGIAAVAPGLPILLHGEEASAWPALELAGRLRLDARIGLEDTVRLPDGTLASSNEDLVAAARSRLGGWPGHRP